jgi:hypothetical protein
MCRSKQPIEQKRSLRRPMLQADTEQRKRVWSGPIRALHIEQAMVGDGAREEVPGAAVMGCNTYLYTGRLGGRNFVPCARPAGISGRPGREA